MVLLRGTTSVDASRMSHEPELLERDEPLRRISGLLQAQQEAGSRGACLLLSGEAGVGKTSLLRRLRDLLPDTMRWLSGTCEPWSLPVPLGPLLDFADALPPSLSHAVRSGAPPRDLLTGLLDLLRDARKPTVLVIDDAQWADDATGWTARVPCWCSAIATTRWVPSMHCAVCWPAWRGRTRCAWPCNRCRAVPLKTGPCGRVIAMRLACGG